MPTGKTYEAEADDSILLHLPYLNGDPEAMKKVITVPPT
jgi:hypothetical protein